MWHTIQGVSVLCVVNVMTTIVVGVDIGMHDTKNLFASSSSASLNPNFQISNLLILILALFFKTMNL